MSRVRFALNHMAAPRLPLAEFFALAESLGITQVEIRNDLAGVAMADGTPADAVRAAAAAAGVTVISINALQRFNDWTSAREAELVGLADYAAAAGAAAVVLVPANDGSAPAADPRRSALRRALARIRPILADRGLAGLVEPLGFGSSSLRSKGEAADAMDAVDGGATFRLVHDTFHHALAGEPELFPERTGLVHISGVADSSVAVAELRDAHRALVDSDDRLGTVRQLRALSAGGYSGAISLEPFAAAVHRLPAPGPAIAASLDFVRTQLEEVSV